MLFISTDAAQTKAKEDEYEPKLIVFSPRVRVPRCWRRGHGVMPHLCDHMWACVWASLTENCQYKPTLVPSRWIKLLFVRKPSDFPFYSVATVLFAKRWFAKSWCICKQQRETFLGWDNRHLLEPAMSESNKIFTTAANINICLFPSLLKCL